MSTVCTPEIEAPFRYWALEELPAFPAITTKLLQMLSNEDARLDELVKLLRSDMSFSAEILRRANSPLYGLKFQVSSLQHAVSIIGFDQTRALAVAVSMGAYLGKAMRLYSLRRCWRHSLATALLAEKLARPVGIEPDRAYTAGMLHDIGLLGLLVKYPASYATMLEVTADSGFDLREAEEALFDVDHCHAGAWIARKWSFGPEIHDAALHHHDTPSPGETSLTAVIYWASLLADTIGFQATPAPGKHLWDELCDAMPVALAAALPDSSQIAAQQISQRVNSLE
jgi:putative nucleotidyltransferase with HDIG domain